MIFAVLAFHCLANFVTSTCSLFNYVSLINLGHAEFANLQFTMIFYLRNTLYSIHIEGRGSALAELCVSLASVS